MSASRHRRKSREGRLVPSGGANKRCSVVRVDYARGVANGSRFSGTANAQRGECAQKVLQRLSLPRLAALRVALARRPVPHEALRSQQARQQSLLNPVRAQSHALRTLSGRGRFGHRAIRALSPSCESCRSRSREMRQHINNHPTPMSQPAMPCIDGQTGALRDDPIWLTGRGRRRPCILRRSSRFSPRPP